MMKESKMNWKMKKQGQIILVCTYYEAKHKKLKVIVENSWKR